MQPNLKDRLAELRQYLKVLPSNIPVPKESMYHFSNFSPDLDWTADFREAAAVNRELEVRFGSRAGGLKIVERGPETEAVVDVLETWIKKYPGNVLLENQQYFLNVKADSTKHKPVNVNNNQPEKRNKVQKLNTHILSTFDNDWYLTADEGKDAWKGGAKMHPLLRKIVKPCHLASNPTATKIVWCIASCGCNVTWAWPRARQCIMKHAAHECPSMAKEWQKEAREYMVSQATGGKAKVTEAALDSDSNENVLPLEKARMEFQAASSLKPVVPFNKAYITEGTKQLKMNGDHALILFITCTGVPPDIIDSKEFRALCTTLNANYKTPCVSTLSERLIPNECARITITMVNYLKTQHDLTITFDGGKDQKLKSFYTVHVTTAECHTAHYIWELLESISGHLRKVLSFMNKSGYAMEHFNYQCNMLKIGCGLEKISKTRFTNIHWSAASLQRGLPAMRAIDLNHFFEENTADSLMFQVDLAKLIAVMGPYAKAIQCLESAQTTCADVYLYWLAIVAQMEQLIQGNIIRLHKETKTAIHTITNAQSKQMINNTPNDPYITAFFLNPGE
ncbi:hypothetical protein C8R48DRAFT_677837 [Suillus tomentosus]|nr:hypothetical protein C8R48DRAFT_677837 [Suillus tomentosus]